MGKADLHLHTRVSDGLATVEQLLDYVETRTDLDVIAVTDHEDATGSHRARELAAKRNSRVDVVVGAEVTTLQGHLLALFIEECPKSFRSIERTLEEIHRQGGLAVVPHPLSWMTRSISRRTIERLMAANEPGVTFDGMETANPSPAGKATQRAAWLLAERWRIPHTGGSDAHHLLHTARGWTTFEGTTAVDLRRSIERGSTRGEMTGYPSLRQVGYGRAAVGLAWGYAATPRKMLRLAQHPRRFF